MNSLRLANDETQRRFVMPNRCLSADRVPAIGGDGRDQQVGERVEVWRLWATGLAGIRRVAGQRIGSVRADLKAAVPFYGVAADTA